MKLKWIVIPVFILAAASMFMFNTKKNEDLPENLIGRWTTSEPKYTDRFLKLTKATFTYGIGESKENVYLISSVKKSKEGNNILYTIYSKDKDGLKLARSFYYKPTNGGVIEFKNQKNIEWKKEKDETAKENLNPDQNKKAGQHETNS